MGRGNNSSRIETQAGTASRFSPLLAVTIGTTRPGICVLAFRNCLADTSVTCHCGAPAADGLVPAGVSLCAGPILNKLFPAGGWAWLRVPHGIAKRRLG